MVPSVQGCPEPFRVPGAASSSLAARLDLSRQQPLWSLWLPKSYQRTAFPWVPGPEVAAPCPRASDGCSLSSKRRPWSAGMGFCWFPTLMSGCSRAVWVSGWTASPARGLPRARWCGTLGAALHRVARTRCRPILCGRAPPLAR